MFSDERIIEIVRGAEQVSFQIPAEFVIDVDASGMGTVQVWIADETRNGRAVILPTSRRDIVTVDRSQVVAA
jgi:hypothetical protein